jgi:hypothetical protein
VLLFVINALGHVPLLLRRDFNVVGLSSSSVTIPLSSCLDQRVVADVCAECNVDSIVFTEPARFRRARSNAGLKNVHDWSRHSEHKVNTYARLYQNLPY